MSEAFVLLDDARPGRELSWLFSGLAGTIVAREAAEVSRALDALSSAPEDGFFAAGYFAYELCYALEPRLAPLMPAHLPTPLLWFGLFRSREELARPETTAWLESRVRGRAYAGPLRHGQTPEAYERSFARVQDYIAAGDTYQVNLSFPARFPFAGDPLALYARLRGRAQAGHGAFVDDGTRHILSFSPELFFAVEDDVLTARPMKGTAPRGADAAQDAQLAARLKASEKDRAENLMIVDLIRNDVGRVARTGTVKVEDLFAVETYPTVHQMVSTVKGQLRASISSADLVRALFPCGSVTGAPKLRAIEIIRELEKEPRGIYCGAIGSFSPDGSATFNVAIRTLTIAGAEGRIGIGGGIVVDSKPDAEYEECLIRFDPAEGIVRRDQHLARLARSAASFGVAFDKDAASEALDRAARDATSPSRLRLQWYEDGSFEMACHRFVAPTPETIWIYRVSPRRRQSGDQLQRHKTSWREFYDEDRASANKTGCDEVIYLNERDELVEGSSTNIFVRIAGRLLTPAAPCGPLDGCLRRALLDNGECTEAVLHLSDLENAEVYLGNSLRGLIRAMPFAR